MVGPDTSEQAETDRPLRILHVIETLGRGGAEQALVSLTAAQVAAGHVVGVIALSAPYELAAALEEVGVTVYRADLPRSALLRAPAAVRSTARRMDAGILHAHLPLAIVAAELASIAASWDLAVTFHIAGYELFPATTVQRRIRKAIEGFLTRHRAAIRTAVSEHVARHYELHFRLPLGSVAVVYNPFPIDELDPARWPRDRQLIRDFGLPDAFLMLMPARFVIEKGHDVLLDAIQVLLADGRKVAALLTGDGPTRQWVETAIKDRGMTGVVKVTPALPRRHVLTLMTAADVVVLPSRLEGLPMTLGEALILGRPVVATSVGGVPELVESGVSGLLVPPDDPARLAVALAAVADHPLEAAARGAYARARLARTLDAEAIARQLEKIYRLQHRRP